MFLSSGQLFCDTTNTKIITQVDRIYIGSPHMIGVFDHEKKRTFLIRKEGLPDAGKTVCHFLCNDLLNILDKFLNVFIILCIVVWNPWEKKAKAIADMGDDEYRQTICVDGAAVEKPITLKPGEEWTGRLEISALPSI